MACTPSPTIHLKPKNDKMNKFLAEILEQPIALEKTLNYYTDLVGKDVLESVKKVFNEKQL